jgi:DNA-binding MarR family transcriptional regulator
MQKPTSSLKLDASWTYKLTVLADRVARKSASVASEIGGLNLSQWRVLAAVADSEGRTSSQVVALTPMDKGIVSRAVASLVQHGFLRREASPEDGRKAHLYMTENGRTLYDAIWGEMQAIGADGEGILDKAETQKFLQTLEFLIVDFPEG